MGTDTSATGKKLLLLDARGTGEDDGARKLLGEGGGGVGEAFSERGASVSVFCSGGGVGALPGSGPKNPVVEKRTSI